MHPPKAEPAESPATVTSPCRGRPRALARAWHALTRQAQLALVALQFLTRVPVPARATRGFEADWLNHCVAHFPLVGAGVGAASAGVLWLSLQLWSPAVAATLAVAFTVWLTGAFHEDGLADTADALGGAVSRAQALVIMKDSRIGTYGATALVLSLGGRIALVTQLATASPTAAAFALTLSHAFGRSAAVAVMASLPYGGDPAHAKAKPLALAVPWGARLGAAVWTGLWLASCAAAAQWAPVAATWPTSPARLGAGWAAAACAMGAVALAMRRWLRRRLGGYTGDGLGATEQACELAVLLALAAVWR